jgi:nitrogen fixation/metabolism regulation signal transduction histidine kinase
MTLRQRLVVTVGIVSLISAAIFSASLYLMVRSTLSFSENRTVERGIEIGVAAARDSVESTEARSNSPDLPEVLKRSTRTMLDEIDALDRIVREFTEFARLPSPAKRSSELNRLLSDTVAQYRLTAEHVAFGTTLDPRVDTWNVDPELMRRVFGNIIKNSIEAVQSARPAAGPRIAVRTELRGTACRITFEDNGPGIPGEIRDRVLDPYVTTKTKGTGLGLAVVRNIVADHRGTVLIECPNPGTRVVITLPKGD